MFEIGLGIACGIGFLWFFRTTLYVEARRAKKRAQIRELRDTLLSQEELQKYHSQVKGYPKWLTQDEVLDEVEKVKRSA